MASRLRLGRPVPSMGRWAVVSTALGAVLAVWWWLRQSPEERVVEMLGDLAANLSVAASATPIRTEPVRDSLSAAVASPLVLTVAETGRQTMEMGELTSSFVLLARQYAGIGFELVGLTVKIANDGTKAQVVGDLVTRMRPPEGGQRVDERRFTAVLASTEGSWRVVRAELMAPRIDQPEARP